MAFLYSLEIKRQMEKAHLPSFLDSSYASIENNKPDMLPEYEIHNKSFQLYKEYVIKRDDIKDNKDMDNYDFVKDHMKIISDANKYKEFKDKLASGKKVGPHLKSKIKEYLNHLDFWNVKYYIHLFKTNDFTDDWRRKIYEQIINFVDKENKNKDRKTEIEMIEKRRNGPYNPNFNEKEWRMEILGQEEEKKERASAEKEEEEEETQIVEPPPPSKRKRSTGRSAARKRKKNKEEEKEEQKVQSAKKKQRTQCKICGKTTHLMDSKNEVPFCNKDCQILYYSESKHY
jgi:hypothetical protein